jgi:hypothetical protein
MDPTDLRAELAERLAGGEPIDAAAFNAACFFLTRALEELPLSAPEATPLVRAALRVAGRVVIDTGRPESSADEWPETRKMAVEWLADALRELGHGGSSQTSGGEPAQK